jgi:hypothetical protein
LPRTFKLLEESGKTYYFRYLDGKTMRIKFNVPDAGNYKTNVPIKVVKIASIEIPEKYPELPPAVRDRWKDVKEWYNPELDAIASTPIRIYTDSGVVEYGNKFLSYPKPIQVFLMQHEKGHFFYTNEEHCDMFALLNYIRMGYNQSNAYYALSHILQRHPANVERLKTLFNNIQKLRK